ncbi:MAG: response regulator [Robiginitomaculum sp.]|nr:response regulator [Robiginitomaculum sp.]
MVSDKHRQADAFVSQLTYVKEPVIKQIVLAFLWAGGVYIALGLTIASGWLAIALTIVLIPNTAYFHKAFSSKPVFFGERIFSLLGAGVWAFAPFMVWQSGEGIYDTLAIMMLGIGFLLVLNTYRSTPKPAVIIAAPYLMLMAWFLYQSRMNATIILSIIATIAYLGTLAGFLYTGYKSKQALITYKIEQDELSAKLVEARDEADKANHAKSTFLANMSHELRTPLNGILGLTDVLLGEVTVPAQHSKLQLVKESGRNLLELLNDILDISKIEAESVTLEQAEYHLESDFYNHFAFWKPFADKKKVKLVYQKQKGLPEKIILDSLRLRQCLNNLITNALKFTPEGGQVTVTLTGKEIKGRYGICFSIHDTGIGMNTEQMSRIFQPFSQADVTTTRKFGGTGLGLMITRKLARLMGGNVNVESVEGKGSVFRLSIMADISDGCSHDIKPTKPLINTSDIPIRNKLIQKKHTQNSPVNFYGQKCLVVEDNDVNTEVLMMLLEPYNLKVTVAENGQEALNALGEHVFDFVLMDLQMPVMDGHEATQRIRASGQNYNKIPIIAMTANAMPEDKTACFASGMNAYVSKPLNRERLAKAIESSLRVTKLIPQVYKAVS